MPSGVNGIEDRNGEKRETEIERGGQALSEVQQVGRGGERE